MDDGAVLKDRYWQDGWLVVEDVFTRDEAEAIAQLATALSQAALEQGEQGSKPGVRGTVDRDDAGAAIPRKLAQPFVKDEAFRRFAIDTRLTRLVELLLGKRPLLCTDQIFMKPPRFGSAKPYHQDNFYFQCFPADDVVTAWIALDDCDEANGCLRYIDGSHRGEILPHSPVPDEPHNLAPDPSLIDLSRESLGIVRKGGVVFHHSQTLHTSHRNHSDRWRRGYATHWVTADVTCTGRTLDNAYFKSDLYPQQAAV